MHELVKAGNRAAIMLLGTAEAIIAIEDALNTPNAPEDQEE